MSTRPYESILLDRLHVDQSFIEAHAARIKSRFLDAADILARRNADMVPDDVFAINQCLHVASTVVLLGSNIENINSTAQLLKENESYADIDPTSVVSAAALFYLLKMHEQNAADDDERRKIQLIKARFDKINWMLTPRAMAALGIDSSV
jgi:hypothetical protein